VIGWALRWVVLCCGIAIFAVAVLERGAALLSNRVPQPASDARPAASIHPAVDPTSNTIVFAANDRGHVILNAAVNGAAVRFLVDTGATLVALTQEDAQAAGITSGQLNFSARVSTANGSARMAPLTLRELRVGQFSAYDVPAAVLENLHVSLLGMSFLSRLRGYEMREGKLTIHW
jgi:aspartyl protease family protein